MAVRRFERLYQPWGDSHTLFGNCAVLLFLIVQTLDGVLTYLGVATWGIAIEANPIVSSVMSSLGLAAGLVSTKLLAITFGIILHLQRVHHLVAILTFFYFAVAIVPWTALFLTH